MHSLVRTARITGLLYLGVAITGLLGFVVVQQQLFVAGDGSETLANLQAHRSLADVGVVLQLLLVLTQALTAIGFHRLFRAVDPVAAAAIAAFGMVNAVVILAGTACVAAASTVAAGAIGDAAGTVQVLYLVSMSLWTAGEIFFGLWLIPMGWCVLRSGWMPRALGWILIGGGAGYVVNAFIGYVFPNAEVVDTLLVLPATAGEFWMIGYLIFRGVRAPESVVTPDHADRQMSGRA
jgi:hypothetical protein